MQPQSILDCESSTDAYFFLKRIFGQGYYRTVLFDLLACKEEAEARTYSMPSAIFSATNATGVRAATQTPSL